jgi:hypothetical protein
MSVRVIDVAVFLASTAALSQECNPNYDPCVPVASDVDCAGGKEAAQSTWKVQSW